MESRAGAEPFEIAKTERESLEAHCICQSLSELDPNAVEALKLVPVLVQNKKRNSGFKVKKKNIWQNVFLFSFL